MRGLTILVAVADAERLHAALSFAAAAAASGAPVRLHLHEGAVGLLRSPVEAPGDRARQAAGLPALAQLIEEALALDVAISVCQSGLALAGLELARLDPRIEAAGPVAIMAGLGEDRTMVF